MLKLLELAVQSASHPVRQVTFQATLGPSYVTATQAQIRQTVHAFLNGGTSLGHISSGSGNVRGSTGGGSARRKPVASPSVGLTPATADEVSQAHTVAASLPIRLYYPMGRVTSAFAPTDMLRPYLLRGDGHSYYAYVVVVAQGGLGQYYDLEGTTWATPPILNNPNQTIQLAGRTMRLYFEGQRLRVVSWRSGNGTYWLTNTLQNILTNRQMLAIAAAARPVK